jgi:hypothetical protein
MGQQWGYRPGDIPVTEALSDRLVRLPFYTGLTRTDQESVIATVRAAPTFQIVEPVLEMALKSGDDKTRSSCRPAHVGKATDPKKPHDAVMYAQKTRGHRYEGGH